MAAIQQGNPAKHHPSTRSLDALKHHHTIAALSPDPLRPPKTPELTVTDRPHLPVKDIHAAEAFVVGRLR